MITSAKKTSIPFRQIHLDFHTHQDIIGIGKDFDPDRFADTLVEARVNSINLFSRCHHGYVYYRSKKFADYQHPHLECDLLREQIAACHACDIKTLIYITVQWDALNARLHPEWLCRTAEGKVKIPVGTPGFYNYLCLNSPYRAWLKEFTTDVLENLDGDGAWFDIVHYRDCFCTHCLAKMRENGIDPRNEDARHRFAYNTVVEFQREMTAHVISVKPEHPIFYNSGHIGPSQREYLESFTHLEIESLPYGWGFDHFPSTARYARTLDMDFLGMTGKFHTIWGDFHSFKTPESLKYECSLMLALGGKCGIGDQLHPRGEICEHTYDLIGEVYRHVEDCEPFCSDVSPVADIAVITPEAFSGLQMNKSPRERIPPAAKGVARLLQELHQQFDMVDTEADLSEYRLAILPDVVPVDERLSEKLQTFTQQGGLILASYRAGLRAEDEEFAIETGARYGGDCEFEPSFLVPRPQFKTGLPLTEHVMYKRGTVLGEIDSEVEVLATHTAPYFNRRWEHYCSHQHAPASGKSLGPAAIQYGNVIYFTHPIFSQFHENAPAWVRAIFAAALQRLLPDPVLDIKNGPTTLFAAVNDQRGTDRRILHLLHAVPASNSESAPTINDEIVLHDVEASMKVKTKVKSVIMQPAGKKLPFGMKNGRVCFSVPRVGLHTMAVVEME